MKKYLRQVLFLWIGLGWCLQAGAEVNLTKLVEKIQPAVVTITTYDMNRNVSGIGSGFFFNEAGYLITNYHVLKQAYAAEIKMLNGRKYPIADVVAQYEPADLIKVWVDTDGVKVPYVKVSDRLPAIAERIVVVGSPMGLEQTVSEGIISAIRQMPTIGSFFSNLRPHITRLERKSGDQHDRRRGRRRDFSSRGGTELEFCSFGQVDNESGRRKETDNPI